MHAFEAQTCDLRPLNADGMKCRALARHPRIDDEIE
jgi:hypothetical protein